MSEYISLENEDYESAHWGTQAKRQGGSDLEERRAASECVASKFSTTLEGTHFYAASLPPSLARLSILQRQSYLNSIWARSVECPYGEEKSVAY